jgi:hypothetical protein
MNQNINREVITRMKNWSSIKAYQDHMDNDIDGISEI